MNTIETATAANRRLCGAAAFFLLAAVAAQAQTVTLEQDDGRADIRVDGRRIATYVWQDEAVPRPYFANVVLPDGTPITRTYPPDPVADAKNDDHATFHPGIWLAFGDLDGADIWRNRARVRQLEIIEHKRQEDGSLTFEVHNVYEHEERGLPPICEERCQYTIRVVEHGVVIVAVSSFTSSRGNFYFGDQEEMGFGARLATPLTVRHGTGTLRNSRGGVNEKGTWGRTADWCAGYAERGNRLVGLSVMAGPNNVRPSWFHSRDYGLIVANPFGRKAMTGPDNDSVKPERTEVEQGDTLDLTFGIYLFACPKEELDLGAAYTDFVRSLEE